MTGGVASYRVPTEEARAELREKGSRFLAIVRPAESETVARSAIRSLQRQYGDATHLCWAWRIGSRPSEGRSDAGEPPGTAGAPMLQVLRGAGLSDVVAVVVRWFGGVKLGKGGLARAYSEVTRSALAQLVVGIRQPTVRLMVSVPYEKVGDLKRLIHPPVVEIVDEAYGERVEVTLRILEIHSRRLEESLAAAGLDFARAGV